MTGYSATIISRFMTRVIIGPIFGCWEWRGHHDSGYGVLRLGAGHIGAHRLSYELYIGPIPPDLHIDHLCRNRGCCNPWHLEPVTPGENILRGETPAARNKAKTHCLRGHLLEGGNLYINKNNGRCCRACAKMWDKIYKVRKKGLTRHPDAIIFAS